MPRSCKCILNSQVYSGKMSREDADKITRNLAEKWRSTSAPPEDYEAVLITYRAIDFEPYCDSPQGVPLVAPAVYCKGRWFWWDATISGWLKKHGDRAIVANKVMGVEVMAWIPFPKPIDRRV